MPIAFNQQLKRFFVSSPNVSLIILNWNGKTDTLECLASLEHITYENYQVIVVDNGSSDDSVTAIKESFPAAQLIETGENLGFAEGNNVGIRYAINESCDYILLLNNDTTVAPDIITEFVVAAENNQNAALLTAKMYYHSQPDTLWYAGAQWDAINCVFIHRGKGENGHQQQYNALMETDYACGCAIFIRTKILPAIGLMDPRFFLTYEETDWCYRARALNFQILYVPKAVLWHKVSVAFGGSGSPLQSYFFMRNRLLWAERHLGKTAYWTVLRYSLQEVFAWHNTKPSLKGLYWNTRNALRRARKATATPQNRAKYLGLRDYIKRRFGDCPNEVRLLSSLKKDTPE